MSTPPDKHAAMYALFLKAFQEYDVEAMNNCLDTIRKLTHKPCTKLIQDNATDDEDIYQAACIEVILSLPSFNNQSRITTWITKIIINLVIDHNRRVTAKKRIQVDDPSLYTHTSLLYEVENYEFINLALRLVEQTFGRKIMLAVWFTRVHKVQHQKEIADLIGIKEAKLSKDITKALAYLRTHPQIIDYGYETGFLDDDTDPDPSSEES